MVSQYDWKVILHRSVSRYRGAVQPVARGPLGTVITLAAFLAGAGIGGRAGVAVAAAWVLLQGTYCLANFWCCREAHCLLTGSGWTALALLGLAAGLAPAGTLGWTQVRVLALGYLLILAAGYAFEGLVAARTGRHSLGTGRDGAEAR